MSELYGKAGWVEDLWLNYEPSRIPPGLTARTIKAVGSYMAYRFGDKYGRNIYASAARIGQGVDGLHESKVKLARKQLERDGRLVPTGQMRKRVPELACCYPDGRSMTSTLEGAAETTRTLEGTGHRTLEGTQPHSSNTTSKDSDSDPIGSDTKLREGSHSTAQVNHIGKSRRTLEGTGHLAHGKPYGDPTPENRIRCFADHPDCAPCREWAEHYAAMDDPWSDVPKLASQALQSAA